jgi:hypothetical protein
MATFRCKERGFASLGLRHLARLRRAVGLLLVVLSLACATREGAPEASAAAAQSAPIERIQIEHVVPRPDFVGPLPVRLEWTPAAGVDSYEVGVENEIEIPLFDQTGIKTTSVPWPKEVKVEPGTYYWRITGYKDGRLVADSGRAAFVVHEP